MNTTDRTADTLDALAAKNISGSTLGALRTQLVRTGLLPRTITTHTVPDGHIHVDVTRFDLTELHAVGHRGLAASARFTLTDRCPVCAARRAGKPIYILSRLVELVGGAIHVEHHPALTAAMLTETALHFNARTTGIDEFAVVDDRTYADRSDLIRDVAPRLNLTDELMI